MNEKLDRRKKYTRMVLKDSLITLLKTKQISSITVKELCDLADINRSTFYKHYTDPFDLLHKMEEEIIEDMNAYLNQYNFAEESESLQMTERLLEYIVTKRDICHTLLNENADTSFERRVMEVSRKFLIQNLLELSQYETSRREYVSIFIISGGIHIIKQWLANDMDRTPKEIAGIISHITKNGLKG
ncbi:TetR/AcrR family transcriptional regulator [Oceanobacillus massiliensis]|uniref:TetR/AcrR family transcriptional regulator n=1 Tax=Oceanobacillus massiliensis TaxID=1465765 RepID=UPI0005CB0E31|nr:TetR-like C-terminal domain-containing protein [Oceanobacillus massiliensis]